MNTSIATPQPKQPSTPIILNNDPYRNILKQIIVPILSLIVAVTGWMLITMAFIGTIGLVAVVILPLLLALGVALYIYAYMFIWKHVVYVKESARPHHVASLIIILIIGSLFSSQILEIINLLAYV